EKMLPGEHYTDAALRCLAEEMSIGHVRVTLLPDTHRIFKEIRVSQSYPGLLSQYTIHRIEAQVAGLPGEDFYTLEDGNGHESVVREHLWRWLPGEQWLT
ncbi:MAG: hypothetical protein JW910_22895, partial [Anaerolineae bacterium]|nr:hypothetical protein [Anaerolineae bacterium]